MSTQAGVMNAVAARMWHELGASRVVCAREMSVEDIARMRADAPRDLELEAFVHGAMCMAVSGRCLLELGHGRPLGQQGALRPAVPVELRTGGGASDRASSTRWRRTCAAPTS